MMMPYKEPGPHRVQVHLITHALQIPIAAAADRQSFVAAGKQMTKAAMPSAGCGQAA